MPVRRFPSRYPLRHSGLAPRGDLGHAVYRLYLSSVDALRQFASTALKAGGVFMRTDDLRMPGTPAIVSVVHPEDGREFHLPGFIQATPPNRSGVSITFTEVTSRTIADFHLFAASSRTSTPALPSASRESRFAEPSRELTLIDLPAVPDSEESLEENTHEFKISDLSSIIDSMPLPGEEDGEDEDKKEPSSKGSDEEG